MIAPAPRIPRLACLAILLLTTAISFAAPLERTTHKGPVTAVVTIDPAEPTIGDTVALTIRATADKDVELLMPQFGDVLDRYAIVDFATTDQIDPEGRTVITQSYVIQPSRSGSQSIPEIMIEFVDRRAGKQPAPEGMDAYELLTERLPFSVKSALPEDLQANLNPPLEELPPLPSTHHSPWPWLAGLLVACLVALPFLWRWWVASRQLARQRSAYEIAIGRLDSLLAQPRQDAEQIDRFFVELSAIVRRYLEDRFQLRAPELTTEEFLAVMTRSGDLTKSHQSLLGAFLQQADLVKFANVTPSESDIDESVTATRRFLEETRQLPGEQDRDNIPPAREVAHA